MSERTFCNFCTLRRLHRKYGARNVSTRPGRGEMVDWIAVVVVGNAEPVAWFKELGESCTC